MNSTENVDGNSGAQIIAEHHFNGWKELKADLFDVLTALKAENTNEFAPVAPPPEYLFRGQACASWRLRTSFDRIMEDEGVPSGQYHRLYNTQLAAFYNYGISTGILTQLNKHFGPSTSFSEITGMWKAYAELQAIGQHYDLPTRVLDWSESPYIAAYFTASQPELCTSDKMALWVLDVAGFKHLINIHVAIFYSRAVDADTRQSSQLAHFTFNYSNDLTTLEDIVTTITCQKVTPREPILFKLTLPVDASAEIMEDLRYMRINDFTIYPDMKGIVTAAKRAVMTKVQSETA